MFPKGHVKSCRTRRKRKVTGAMRRKRDAVDSAVSEYPTGLHSCTGNDSTTQPLARRRTCSFCRSMFRRHSRSMHFVLRLTWLSTWLLLLLRSTPVSGITLPVAMPPSHPKHFLTVIGQTPEPKEKNEASVRPVEVQGPVIREDEIMYHFYKNGRVGSDYRKASTTFMVRLFNDLLRGMTPPRPIMKSGGADGDAPGDGKTAPFTDTIRSFSAADVTTTKKKKTVVSFFVPFLPPNERLRLAEVRFLRHPSARKRKKRYKLRIDVVRSGRRVERVMLRERADIQRDYDVFDVSRLLQPWINTHHGNVSLQIRLPRKLEKNILLKDSTMKSTSLIALYLEDSEFLKNMYESYTTDDVHANSSDPTGGSNEASRRRTRSKREAKKRRHKSGRKGKRWYRAGKHEKCQMYDFKVDFDFIGWGQWIIHPKSFNSRFCYGECPSPVDTKYKPTNHAMLQTLMRQKKPRLAPPTCCVPIKLKPLSMLYFEYDEIVVRHHENMIADECGCR
ncbi:hypothetical protein BaRGS_00001147 [Batillaria attramentaria]|uniref:TGF-beta family profile domain-containing protein n=1 Tax=Batillaria attramentaria TaxID=370345 RepID=A0ABD0M6C8_9CAEN